MTINLNQKQQKQLFALKQSILDHDEVELQNIITKVGSGISAILKDDNLISMAIQSKNVKIVDLLLQNGANPDGVGIKNISALSDTLLKYQGTKSNAYYEIAKTLLKAGANPNFIAPSSNSTIYPLKIAYQTTDLRILELILEYDIKLYTSSLWIQGGRTFKDVGKPIINAIFKKNDDLTLYYPHIVALYFQEDQSDFHYLIDQIQDKGTFADKFIGFLNTLDIGAAKDNKTHITINNDFVNFNVAPVVLEKLSEFLKINCVIPELTKNTTKIPDYKRIKL